MTFGRNVKRLRKQQALSLKALAELSGVSFSMLSKVEREEKNPTLNVAVRIARALKSPLSALAEEEHPDDRLLIVRKAERKLRINAAKGVSSEMIISTVPADKLEMVSIELLPGAATGLVPPHPAGAREYVFVRQGRVRFCFAAAEHDLAADDYLYFQPDSPYQLANPSDAPATVFVVIDHSGEKAPSSC